MQRVEVRRLSTGEWSWRCECCAGLSTYTWVASTWRVALDDALDHARDHHANATDLALPSLMGAFLYSPPRPPRRWRRMVRR